MKYPKNALFAVSLSLAFSGALAHPSIVHAELVREEISDDSIVPEESQAQEISALESDDEVIVERRIVKKKPQERVWKKASNPRRVIIQEVQAHEEEAGPVTPVAVVPAQKQETVGSAVDSAIENKMNQAKQKLADALVKAMDNIQISVGDEQQLAAAQTPQAVTTTIVQDSVVSAAAAPTTATVDNNTYADLDIDGTTEVKKAEVENDEILGKVSVFPMAGFTSIGSDYYNIESRSSLGIGLEVDINSGFRFVGSYMYNKYDISLGSSNPFTFTTTNNLNKLEYNQNVVDAGVRYYMLPKSSRFQFFVGSGLGFNKGFLNYRQNTLNTFAGNQFSATNGALDDYEVTSYLGIIEAGGDVRLSRSISVGANFKYNTVLSSSENKPINNNGFITNAVGLNGTNDKNIIGGSISGDSFYSILGNVKVSF